MYDVLKTGEKLQVQVKEICKNLLPHRICPYIQGEKLKKADPPPLKWQNTEDKQ